MPPEGPEAPRQDEQIAEGQKPQAEEPKRSLEDVQKEHDEQRGRKEERDAEEKTERKNESKGAEDLLEQEIMKELFQDMENGLKGDAKEVFTAIKGELTDAERVDLAKTFNNFQEIADQNHANVNQKLYNTPKEEYLQKARANRSAKVANTFQNSIEQYFDEPDTVSTSAKRLAEETNEKSNNQFQSATAPNSRLAWKKVGALVEAHVAANPNKKRHTGIQCFFFQIASRCEC